LEHLLKQRSLPARDVEFSVEKPIPILRSRCFSFDEVNE